MAITNVIHSKIENWCKSYNGEKFHALFCDPPYELGFMGKAFDKTGVSFRSSTWAALRADYPPDYLSVGARARIPQSDTH